MVSVVNCYARKCIPPNNCTESKNIFRQGLPSLGKRRYRNVARNADVRRRATFRERDFRGLGSVIVSSSYEQPDGVKLYRLQIRKPRRDAYSRLGAASHCTGILKRAGRRALKARRPFRDWLRIKKP